MNARLKWGSAIAAGFLLTTTVAVAQPASSTAPAPPPSAKISLVTALSTTNSSTIETTAGDLIADSVRDAGRADVALVPSDEIAADVTLAAGNHTPNDLLSVLRYGQDSADTVVVLNVTGSQLHAALERSVSRSPQAFDGFFQVSGLEFRFDASKPIGKRIIEAGVPGEPLSKDKHYTVATTRSAANGSFGYFRVWDRSAIASDTGVTVAKSLTDYAALHLDLSPMLDGRIVGL